MKNIFLRKISGSFAVLFFLVAITVPAPIFAATKGGVNPGNTFYAFDIFFEKVDLAFTFNKEKRVQKIIASTEERLAEAEEAVAEDKPDIAEKAIAKYQEGISSAVLEAKNIDDKEKSKETLSGIGDNVSKHQDVLTSVYNSAPEASKESVGKAIAINVAEQEKIKEELDQVIISLQGNEDSVKAQNEAEKIIVVENQSKKEIENKEKQEANTNVNIAPKEKENIVPSEQKQTQSNSATIATDITSKPASVSSKISNRGGGGSGGVAMSGSRPVNPAIPATPATPATSNNPAIPATPAIPANPSQSSSSNSVSSFFSSSSVYSSSSVSSSSSSIATSSSSSSVATSSSSATSSASSVANDNLGPWITSLSISPTSINPGGLVTFTVTAEDLNGMGSIIVDIKYPNSNYYLRPNFNFSGATSGTQTFTETIDHGISPTILGDYTIVTIRAVDSLGNLSTYYPGGTVTGAKQGTHALTIPVINVSESVQSSSSSISSSSSSLAPTCYPSSCQLINDSSPQTAPRISGSNVIWQDSNGLYYINLVTKERRVIASFPVGVHDIDDNKVVYSMDSQIYLYDINTNVNAQITHISDGTGAGFPSVNGNYISWFKSSISGEHSIFLYNIASGETKQITGAVSSGQTGSFAFPVVHNDKIVYEKINYNPSNTPDIYLYNISTNIATKIGVGNRPSVYGDYVLWYGSGTSNPITLYQISTQAQKNIGEGGYVRMQGDKVVFWSSTDRKLHAYTISLDQTISGFGNDRGDGGGWTDPDIYGDTVVFGGNTGIYYIALPDNQ